jgi:hypothetical protein
MDFEKAKNSLFQIPEVCPNCSHKFNKAEASIIGNKGNSIIIHITCPYCGVSMISNISLNSSGIMTVGMLTDLSKKDLGMLKGKSPISVDDIIEIYEYIEKKGSIKFN